MFRRIKRYFAVRSYVRRLGPQLVRRFGKRRFYTPEQVRKAVRGGGFSEDDICYAYSLFCSREDFEAHHAASGESCDYDEMRAEVSHSHFSGSTDFEPSAVIHYAEQHSTYSGHDDVSGPQDTAGQDSGGHH